MLAHHRLVAVALTLALAFAFGGCGDRRRFEPRLVLIYEVEVSDGTSATQARDRALHGLRERLDDREVRAAVVADGAARIRVELAGDDLTLARLTALLERRAVLGIHRVDEDSVTMRALTALARAEAPTGITATVDHWRGPDGDAHQDDYLWSLDRPALEAWIAAAPTRDPQTAVAADRRLLLEAMSPHGAGSARWRTYLVDPDAIITGDDVDDADLVSDPDTLQLQVRLRLSDDGRVRFGTATAAALGHKLAIVLDGKVQSAPVVQSPIPGGEIVVTMGNGSPEEVLRQASDLVAVLRAGRMPPLRRVHSEIVGPAR